MREFLFILLLTLTIATPGGAQEATDDLTYFEQILRAVPADASALDSIILYADMRVTEQGRVNFPIVRSDDQLNNVFDNRLLSSVYIAGLPVSIFPEFAQSSMFADPQATRASIGFNIIDIDRMLTWNNPPEQMRVMIGTFEPEAIADALTARDYVAVGRNEGFTLYCSDARCEDGAKINVGNRNTANPFGGQLGRSEPFVVTPNMIINSPDIARINQIAPDYIAGNAEGLLAIPAYRLLANTLSNNAYTETGVLRQASLLPLRYLWSQPADSINLLDIATGANLPTELSPMTESALPVYLAAGIADLVREDDEITLLTLVFPAAEDAMRASEVLRDRIENYMPQRYRKPIMDIMADYSITVDDALIETDDTNNVTLLTLVFRNPQPSNTPAENGRLIASGVWYRFIYDSLASGDIGWLALEVPSDN